jgi:hypothetical protein
MDEISKLKIEIFDAQREQEHLHFRIREIEREKLRKIDQLKKLESSVSSIPSPDTTKTK